MDPAIYDRMAEIDGEHWWFAARREIVARLIADRVRPRPGARILEVGAGTGSNLAMLQRFGRVDAIEPDAGARALAASRSGVAVGGGSLPDDGKALPDGHYDMIVLLDVLEHIDDDRAALRLLLAKLAPGGKLVLTVPAMPWMWSLHDVAHHHKRRYTVVTLCQALMESGYRLDHMSHFNTLLFPLIAGIRLWGPRFGRLAADDAMPSRPVNWLLRRIFAAERYFVTRATVPFGVSLLAVAEAPPEEPPAPTGG
jgi:SAM-dependent methyltransferase